MFLSGNQSPVVGSTEKICSWISKLFNPDPRATSQELLQTLMLYLFFVYILLLSLLFSPTIICGSSTGFPHWCHRRWPISALLIKMRTLKAHLFYCQGTAVLNWAVRPWLWFLEYVLRGVLVSLNWSLFFFEALILLINGQKDPNHCVLFPFTVLYYPEGCSVSCLIQFVTWFPFFFCEFCKNSTG